MDRLEILKKAKEKVDALVAEKRVAEAKAVDDEKEFSVALDMARHESLLTAIENNYTSPEEMARVFAEAVSQISVNVPEIAVPLIQIPDIKVPEAKVTVNIPEIKLPTINVPEPKVTVNVPEVKIPAFPEIKMPDSMEIHGEVGLFGYGFNNPLPVQLRDAEGNPINLSDLGGGAVSGGGGRFVKITNDSDNPVPITTIPSAITATTADATASGDNTIVSITNTPRLYYISLSANGANSADVTAIVKIGATSKYKVSLKAGAIWARHIGAGNSYVTGASGDDIIVNLSAAQTVHVSVEYADV